MIEKDLKDMSLLFSMFSDVTRLKILSLLFKEEMSVTDIAKSLNMSNSAISHQLSTLRKVKLVTGNRQGKHIYYSLADSHIKNIFEMAYEHIKE